MSSVDSQGDPPNAPPAGDMSEEDRKRVKRVEAALLSEMLDVLLPALEPFKELPAPLLATGLIEVAAFSAHEKDMPEEAFFKLAKEVWDRTLEYERKSREEEADA